MRRRPAAPPGRPERVSRPAVGRAAASRLPALAVAALMAAPSGRAAAQDAERGRVVYDAWCAECHGPEGRGDGPAAERMLPRPRDFTGARYQIRTTGSGELPTDEDLLRIVRDGMPGTAMPGWPNLSSARQRDVVAYLKSLSPFFEGAEPVPLERGRDPGGGGDALESGRAAYEALECNRCHGPAGRGDGTSAATLEDWRGLPIRAADLTEPWTFNGGSRVEDIYTRIMTGLDGTPMPSAIEAVQGEVVTQEQVWHLAHYVRSLAPSRPPRLREVVRVRRSEGELPEDPEAEAWEEAEAYYFPLVGQVIQTPRNFAPAVDGVWVEGLHDGSELALRLSWNDPSRSPDPAWSEWQERMAAALFADGVEIPTDPLPDAFAVQIPEALPRGSERPYFLMGARGAPVRVWRWSSEDGVSEARATGLGATEPVEATVRGRAVHRDGRWRLVLHRALAAGEGGGPDLVEGAPVPIAFYAWDGSSGEEGSRGSIGSWYYLLLEEPGSPVVVLVPLLAVVVTGGLGLVAVRRARRRWAP